MAITTSYPKGMERLLQGSINFATDTIKVALVTDAYTYSAAHEFVSQLGTRVGDDITLVNKTVTGGVFDADDAETAPLVPGSTIKAIVIYKDTGNPSTSPLLLYRDNVAAFPWQRMAARSNCHGTPGPWASQRCWPRSSPQAASWC